ncbi:MAG: hypothetical protein ACXW3Z_03935 [Limisphaerales bacterium]
MENNSQDEGVKEMVTPEKLTPEQLKELEAKKKLSRPPKDKSEITIGPTDGTGPDVNIT